MTRGLSRNSDKIPSVLDQTNLTQSEVVALYKVIDVYIRVLPCPSR